MALVKFEFGHKHIKARFNFEKELPGNTLTFFTTSFKISHSHEIYPDAFRNKAKTPNLHARFNAAFGHRHASSLSFVKEIC
jgi:hypothetical protein